MDEATVDEGALAGPGRSVEADDRHRLRQDAVELHELAVASGHQVRVGVGQKQRIRAVGQGRRAPPAPTDAAGRGARPFPAPRRFELPADEAAEGVGVLLEADGETGELAAEVAHDRAGPQVRLTQLGTPRVGGHEHGDRQTVLESRLGLPPRPGMEAVTAGLGRRHLAAAVADEREHEVRLRHLTEAGGHRRQSARAGWLP